MAIAEGWLRRDHAAQKDRFEELARRFSETYAAIAAFTDPRLMTDVWEAFNARLERALLPSPAYCFLRDATIGFTMFVDARGRWLASQRNYLERSFEPRRLAELAHEDPVGCPPLAAWSLRSSHNTLHHLYHYARFTSARGVELEKFSTVVEWGAGYGNQARLLHRLNPRVTYVAIDTPLLSTLQWLYLSSILGTERVHLLSKADDTIQEGSINLVPLSLVEDRDIGADLFISTWALSESSEEAQDVVLERKWFGAEHLLLAFQKGFDMGDLRLTASQRVGALAQGSGAHIEEVGPFLPDNYYAFL